jgi:ABC-type transporter Mla subunit MlaD
MDRSLMDDTHRSPRHTALPRRFTPWLAVLVALVLFACGGDGPLRFAVTFQDAQGIERGDDVEYKGIEVGEVTRVAIDEEGNVRVEVEIRPRHRASVAMNSLFEVERAGVLGGRKLVIVDGEGARIPMLAGAVLVDKESEGTRAIDTIRQAGQDALHGVSALGASLAESVRGVRDSEKAKDLVDSLNRFGEEAATMTREQADRFRQERLPAIRERAEALRRELEGKGLDEEAKKIWQDFEQWLEEVRGGPEGNSR